METLLVWGFIVIALSASVVVEVRNERARRRALAWSEMTDMHRLARCVGARRE